VLRITRVTEKPAVVTLKLEGRIVADWASVLERECSGLIQEGQSVLLDFSEVRFVDGRGLEVLKRIGSENLQIINSSDLIKELLKGGGES
jgi:anti-anti-sigma regulatory factor